MTCSQGCVNTLGSYYCECIDGYHFTADNETCVAINGDAILTYATVKQVNSFNLNKKLMTVVGRSKQPIGVFYDGHNFLWTDYSESIYKLAEESTKKERLIFVGLELPENLAVDWLTGNIYFTDSVVKHIAMCTSDGFFCKPLIATEYIDQPRAIALHPPEGLMFWSDWGKKAHIGVASMDGSLPAVLVEKVGWPNGIALDWANGRLYWVDALKHTIESVDIAGKDRRVIRNDLEHPFGLAVFENKLYWSDWNTKRLLTCNKFTGEILETLREGETIHGEGSKQDKFTNDVS